MESTVSIYEFQEELQTWKHELSSFKQEIRHFERHLESLSARPLPKDLLAQIEHFQNSFICQKEVIDHLRHDLPDSPHKVENIFRTSLSRGLAQNHDSPHHLLEERMDTFRKIYTDIREHFKRFESEWV